MRARGHCEGEDAEPDSARSARYSSRVESRPSARQTRQAQGCTAKHAHRASAAGSSRPGSPQRRVACCLYATCTRCTTDRPLRPAAVSGPVVARTRAPKTAPACLPDDQEHCRQIRRRFPHRAAHLAGHEQRNLQHERRSAICSDSGREPVGTREGQHKARVAVAVKTRAEKSDLKSTLGLRGRKSGFARSWRHSTCKTPQRRGGRALHTHRPAQCARGLPVGRSRRLHVLGSVRRTAPAAAADGQSEPIGDRRRGAGITHSAATRVRARLGG